MSIIRRCSGIVALTAFGEAFYKNLSASVIYRSFTNVETFSYSMTVRSRATMKSQNPV